MFIRQLTESDPIPYDMLILADPERDIIDLYIYKSLIFGGFIEEELIACYVLDTNDQDMAEIKNIAVAKPYQNQGIGKSLLLHAIQTAKSHQKKQLVIATADTSAGQLHLYQNGFQYPQNRKGLFYQTLSKPNLRKRNPMSE
jgi:N-acetylglutamate synthase-like GNAT family acetyltransferase